MPLIMNEKISQKIATALSVFDFEAKNTEEKAGKVFKFDSEYSPEKFIIYFSKAVADDQLYETIERIISSRQFLNKISNEIFFEKIAFESTQNGIVEIEGEEYTEVDKLNEIKNSLIQRNPRYYHFPLKHRQQVNSTYKDIFRIENEFIFTVLSILEISYSKIDKTVSIKEMLKADNFKELLLDEDIRHDILRSNPNLYRYQDFLDINLCILSEKEGRNQFSPQKNTVRENRQILRGCILLALIDLDLLERASYSEIYEGFKKSGLSMPTNQKNFDPRLKRYLEILGIYESKLAKRLLPSKSK
jgi:hypothetical protein